MTQQKCNSPECNLFAEYKAPLSPDNLRQYQWFCLQHIKEYNKNWNYFENMTADEIETFIENDIIGHRKTQKIGATNSDYFNKTNKKHVTFRNKHVKFRKQITFIKNAKI